MSVEQADRAVHKDNGRDVWVTTGDGVRLAVRDYCPAGARHTVVFLHGMCLSRASWARQIGYVRRRFGDAVRVISYDHRGHGQSATAPASTYHVEQLGADLDDVLEQLGVRRPVTFVTHSMGGMAALAYLSNGRRTVDVDGLVLVATAAGRITERGLGRLLGFPAATSLFSMVEHAPAFALKSLAVPVCSAASRWYGCGQRQRHTLAAVAAEALASTAIGTILGFLAGLARHNQYEALSAITARTVVISGSDDVLTPLAHAKDLVAGIAGAKHVHVHGVGHMLPQDAPGVVNNAICWAMNLDAVTGPLEDMERVVPAVGHGVPGWSAWRYVLGAQGNQPRSRSGSKLSEGRAS